MVALATPRMLSILSAAPNKNDASSSADWVVVAIFGNFVFWVICVIMPIIWIRFYQSPHVTATCEARDTTPRWTDACPLPVLALCVWLAADCLLSAVVMLLQCPCGHNEIDFFGISLTGFPAVLDDFVMIAFWICAIWLLYKLDMRGWWLALAGMIVGAISTIVRQNDNVIAGYSHAQLQMLSSLNELATWAAFFLWVLPVIYMLFIKRYLRRKA
jgi:hypothetical protein